jgi:hypothetical protein
VPVRTFEIIDVTESHANGSELRRGELIEYPSSQRGRLMREDVLFVKELYLRRQRPATSAERAAMRSLGISSRRAIT